MDAERPKRQQAKAVEEKPIDFEEKLHRFNQIIRSTPNVLLDTKSETKEIASKASEQLKDNADFAKKILRDRKSLKEIASASRANRTKKGKPKDWRMILPKVSESGTKILGRIEASKAKEELEKAPASSKPEVLTGYELEFSVPIKGEIIDCILPDGQEVPIKYQTYELLKILREKKGETISRLAFAAKAFPSCTEKNASLRLGNAITRANKQFKSTRLRICNKNKTGVLGEYYLAFLPQNSDTDKNS